MAPAVACGAVIACHLNSAAASLGRTVGVRRCFAARPRRGAALLVRASQAPGETPATAPAAARVALPRRGVLLAAGVALLLPALDARADDVSVNPEPLGNGARCAARRNVRLGCRLTRAPCDLRVHTGLMRYYGRATSSSSCASPQSPRGLLALPHAVDCSEPRHLADGGYGGSDTNYKYSFILPLRARAPGFAASLLAPRADVRAIFICFRRDTWKPDTVSKVEKATNGTDARFVDPKNKEGA